MRRITTFFLMVILTSVTAFSGPPANTGNWQVVLNETFPGSSIRTGIWNVKNNAKDWDKNGKQCYFRKSNVRVTNNDLFIDNGTHVPELWNGADFTGAWLSSKAKYKYGYFEVKCRTLNAVNDKYIWPTFWLWDGKSQSKPVEFDVFELHKWNDHPEQTLHYKNDDRLTNYANVWAHQYHTYGLLWTYNKIEFYIDGVKQRTTSSSGETYLKAVQYARQAVKQPLIISCSPNRERIPPSNISLPSFQVDYVKVWQLSSMKVAEVLGDSKTESQINVYPNPASEILTIAGIPEGNYKIDLYNIQGGLVEATLKNQLSAQTELDISTLPAGIYFLKIQGSDITKSVRFIKN